MHKLTKKGGLVIAGTAIAVAAAGTAYAYWTTSGSGTGTATTGTSSTITIHGTSDGVDVTPGGETSVISFTADNPSSGHQYVTTVHLVSVDAFSDAARSNAIPTGTGPGKCDTTMYSMPDVTANQDIAPGNGTALTATGVLSLANDLANNQDACKGAYLTLNLTSS